ncbi:serine/threonine-protein phosphatase with EF-hands 1 [Pteronotus mesoamericanus]|uniref:serine/threonine-protein phosphatase with EF-hands 1 n=1 Tax=Pteronotus mesoamericanus TaxID=1884717 RepID=UPI0023ED5AFC|nr:serine/threonine-protein phosphatase with EF-hands 1 [Pteronotus parnellii mesoamericanus]
MGCGSSIKIKKTAKTIKAALIIQNWYRGYSARLRTREHYALTVFQTIEYADEQGQLQLSDFFSFMLENYACIKEKDPSIVNRLFGCALPEEKTKLDFIGMIEIPDSYTGPRLKFPLTVASLHILIEAFKKQQILHASYVLEVLFETKEALMQMPNFTRVRTYPTKEITVCGDLHGKLDDLLLIFSKNGLPSSSNPYVFNGDFVDRGKNSIEILMILFVSFLLYGDDLCLNRGNHEDFLMNMRYGFTREVLSKYKIHGEKILQFLEEVFAWLPIGTIIDEEILIVHGGISESTDLTLLNNIERNKLKSVLMPPVPIDKGYAADLKKQKGRPSPRGIRMTGSTSHYLTKYEWEQVTDILWSDPREKRGCYPNTCRGGGCYFGPDVTSKFLKKNHLKLLIRSHECKREGYEFSHEAKVITVFSASNYYEEGSNRGAYIKVGFHSTLQFFQYQVTKATCLRPLHQRVYTVESSAMKILKERMIARKTDLINIFQLQDHNKTGKISMSQWAFSMETVLRLNLPWRCLSPRLVITDQEGNVDYMSCFNDVHIQKPVKEVQSALIETLYRYRSDLQVIFNVIDSDHSGLISMEEFHAMWKLFSSHYNVHIDDSQVDELAKRMDLNKDGSIDFNEFFKAFYVVHKFDNSNKENTNTV